MSALLSKRPGAGSTFIGLVVILTAVMIWQSIPPSRNPRRIVNEAESAARVEQDDRAFAGSPVEKRFSAEPALRYLEQSNDGQSLMQAVTVARFGLQRQDHAPFDEKSGAGYLGMSHDQNLNAWFDDEGVTLRPTVSKKQRQHAWQLGFRFKSYGYGHHLRAAPPIVSHHADQNKIEYHRAQSPSASGQSLIVERYVNQAAGIEQTFVVNERPSRDGGLSDGEPLRLVVSVMGDLRARAAVDGDIIELSRGGQGILSYSHLVATDNAGKKLTARMETNAAGDEIALVVDDAGAEYPIVVDPVTATQKQKLDGGVSRQADARFGFAVATQGGVAIVGAWREDLPGTADAGGVYVFLRSSSGNWTLLNHYNPDPSPGASCGWSVDIHSNASEPSDPIMLYGCPGANNGIGRAFFRGPFANNGNGGEEELVPFASAPGDAPRHGTSVALGISLFVGAPSFDSPGLTNNGIVTAYGLLNAKSKAQILDPNPKTNDQFGASIAASAFDSTSTLLVVGEPNAFSNTGTAVVFTPGASLLAPTFLQYLQPDNVDLGANFGSSVAVGDDTVVVGAPFDDNERGTDAGAAYVFVRGSNGSFSQQQKLTASNGRANDHFSEHAVAVQGHLMVVGANGHDRTAGAGFDVGAAYLFSRNGTVWTEETTFAPNEGFGATDGDQFGISVGLSFDTIIVGARAASALDNTNVTGAAYTYGIDCIPAYNSNARIYSYADNISLPERTECHGTPLVLSSGFNGGTAATIQWRRNGVNIPGATTTSLSLTATVATEGTYDFVISNACGSEISKVAILNVRRFTLSPNSQNVGAAGSDGLFKVTTSAACGYAALSNDSWIHIKSNANGTSPQDVGFHVDANTGPNQRAGSIMVGDKTFNISQDGLNCSYSISPLSQNFTAAGGANSVAVTATAGCGWTAASNASWINVTSGTPGAGNGNVAFTVAANSGPQRSGSLAIAGQTFTVTQDGATPTPTPTPTPTATPTPTPNVVQFSSSNYSVQEDCTTVTITVSRIGDTSGGASVDYSTSDVSATERKDYIAALGTLRFAAGETSKSFTVLINEDSFVEGSETFSSSLSNPVGVTLGGPAISTITITDDASEPAANAIDDAQTYVCQHYHDFLNRQPDPSGLQFWTNQITSCGNDQACIEARRINVSASFFLSIEFQDTGYLVERIYRAAYADASGNSTFPSAHQLAVPMVRLNEFLSDSQEIGQGIVVGQGSWQQQLENNKQSFTVAFVQRSRFQTAFPNSMTAAQFVDTLNANAGNPLSSAERNQLVNDLSTGARTRAQVLRAVAEDPDLNTAESNRAFVLMQYFGYLRRNPNDPQDTDHTGYDFWLTKLNQFGGNYISAEMVKAFITSIEYRQRFGP